MSYRLILSCCCFAKRRIQVRKIKVNPTCNPVVYGYSKKYSDW